MFSCLLDNDVCVLVLTLNIYCVMFCSETHLQTVTYSKQVLEHHRAFVNSKHSKHPRDTHDWQQYTYTSQTSPTNNEHVIHTNRMMHDSHSKWTYMTRRYIF